MKWIRITLAIAAILLLSGAFLDLISLFGKSKSLLNKPIVATSFGVVLTVMIGLIASTLEREKGLYISYNISIFGLPQSGKTTLITSLINTIMNGKIHLEKYIPILKGKATIREINRNISYLDKGIIIPKTNNENRFSYRVNLEARKELLSTFNRRSYRLEFGDFPGEDSIDISEGAVDHMSTDSDYFLWAKDSDAFLFFIDLGQYFLTRNDYVASISSSIRIAWQNILDSNGDSIENFRKSPVVIVFNKIDLFQEYASYESNENFDAYIRQASYGMKNKWMKESQSMDDLTNEDVSNMLSMKHEVVNDFQNLLSYFDRESKRFAFVFTSSVLIDIEGVPLGLKALFEEIIPKK